MAEASIDAQGTAQRSEGTTETPVAVMQAHWLQRFSSRISLFQAVVAMVVCALLVNLLVLSDLQQWVQVIQVVAGCGVALLALAAGALAILVSSLSSKKVCIGAMYILDTIAVCLLDAEFGKAVQGHGDTGQQVPGMYGVLAIATTLPIMFQRQPTFVLVVSSVMNVVAFAFRVASYESASTLLGFFVFEAAAISLSVTLSQDQRKLTTVVDLSKTTTFALHEEPVGSELEVIVNRLQKVHSNAEEAIAAARTSEELQRATESEMLMRDLLTRLKTRNVYAVSPDRLTMRMSQDEKTYIEENYLPPALPTARRLDRHSSTIDPLKYTLQELVPLLAQIGRQWNFDTDFLAGCSDNHPVSCVGDYLFRTMHLNKRLGLNAENVYSFFQRIESGYLPNSYHNSTHAADVMFSVYFLSKSSGLNFYSTDLEVAASVVATLGHDIGHLGFNNRYLINSRHALAIEYNDTSVLEMMHASKTFQLAGETKAFSELSTDSWLLMRRQVIEMILATDMAKHFELLSQFRITITSPQLDEEATRLFLYKMLLKCADIGHSAKITELHERWSLRVMEEFFSQGDAEKASNLPVSMFCDRETTDFAMVRTRQSQKGFLENLAYPLFEAVATTLRSEVIMTTCVQQITRNAMYWARKQKRRASTLQNKKIDEHVTLDFLERMRLSATNLLNHGEQDSYS